MSDWGRAQEGWSRQKTHDDQERLNRQNSAIVKEEIVAQEIENDTIVSQELEKQESERSHAKREESKTAADSDFDVNTREDYDDSFSGQVYQMHKEMLGLLRSDSDSVPAYDFDN